MELIEFIALTFVTVGLGIGYFVAHCGFRREMKFACNTGESIKVSGDYYNIMSHADYTSLRIDMVKKSGLEIDVIKHMEEIGELKSTVAGLADSLRQLDAVMQAGQMHSTETMTIIEMAMEATK